MQALKQNIGFEMLSDSSRVKVSRFSRRVRLLHWYNAAMILTLYALGIDQLLALVSIGFYGVSDLRPLHIQVGVFWLAGVLILGVIARVKPAFERDVIVADSLVIKQRIFLYASTLLMLLMALTGLGMYLMRPYDVPQIRSIFLTLHGIIAFSYLPILSFHIYLAILQRESRQSLKTMVMDVYLKYLIHNQIPQLNCWLSDSEQVLFVHGQVSEISLVGFHVNIKAGQWQQKIQLNELANVEFQHPDLEEPLRIAVAIFCDYQEDGILSAEFKFQISMQESAQILLSRAIFFRALFLARRHHPRLACHFPVEVSTKTQSSMGQVVDLCHGGLGLLIPLNLRKGSKLNINIHLKNPQVDLQAIGKIAVKEKISDHDWSYGLCFIKLKDKQNVQVLKLIEEVKINSRHKNTRYW